ncbi:C-C motif chemokine 22-like isoform X1 [Scomber scombrus]|uniref:C-C motif chemokine 22-like isoform X1 n=1 Tax=Scomber scombrus TaxID=13677 RepID=UPI002DDC1DB6|nr:C-C motif chemokine 22-like isoform X1 [Scomber scombrus]
MKTLPTLILLALICFLHHSSASLFGPGDVSAEPCCPGFTKRLIPKPKVKHVAKTSNSCKITAIVVTTVCDVTSCIDPEWQWAKNLLDEFETATFNNTSPSAPFNTSNCDKEKKLQKASG